MKEFKSRVTVVFLLHGVFAFTGELTLQLPVNFTSSGFNKLFQLQDYKFKSRVQVLSPVYKSKCSVQV